eukprot:scaffold428444_cov34-Prasinocladus_malaysianus.AAC.1
MGAFSAASILPFPAGLGGTISMLVVKAEAPAVSCICPSSSRASSRVAGRHAAASSSVAPRSCARSRAAHMLRGPMGGGSCGLPSLNGWSPSGKMQSGGRSRWPPACSAHWNQ